jgi:transcription elongation GreA/GreB family factor
MSRAFVKEDAGGEAHDLPERPVPSHANYVTAQGLVQLQTRERELSARHEALKAVAESDDQVRTQRTEIARDLRYLRAQLERAQVVAAHPPAAGETPRVRFGATVEIVDDSGVHHRYRIVGDDEADATKGDISWASPLAKALIGALEGDVVTWRRPAGVVEVEVVRIGVTRKRAASTKGVR